MGHRGLQHHLKVTQPKAAEDGKLHLTQGHRLGVLFEVQESERHVVGASQLHDHVPGGLAQCGHILERLQGQVVLPEFSVNDADIA